MDIFSDYSKIIQNALSKESSINERNLSSFIGDDTSKKIRNFKEERNSLKLSETSKLYKIASEIGAKPLLDQAVGQHPDFIDLKDTNDTRNHYIISSFIDIRRSTNLFKKYDEETVYMITNTVQLAAIAVCTAFGGFIHRLQGDGLFVYFGRKNLNKTDAIKHSIAALSLFSHYMKTDLKRIFERNGIDAIYSTIGVDFGDDDKVLWAMAGINDTSEITTYSLHTSLASKMQGYAKANEIIVGENIKTMLNLNDDSIFNVVEGKRYIFQDPDKNFYYTQYVLNWMKYLRRLDFIATSPNTGNLAIKSTNVNQDLSSLKEIASANKPYIFNN